MRKEFINGVSHELKTPLGIMKSYAEALQDGIGKQKQPYYASVILDEIDRMDALVMDMLEISKLQSGSYKLKREAVDLNGLINDILARLDGLFDEKDLKCECVSYLEQPTVWADYSKLEMVLNNLLSNAIRYGASHGEIRIIIKPDAPGSCYVGIENDGDVIPEDKMSKIWEKFYRVESSRNKDNGGSGLGLAIVKNILDLYGSNYGVFNLTEQRGVCFYFTLRMAEEEL